MSSTTIGQEDVASGASSLGLSAALTGCGLASGASSLGLSAALTGCGLASGASSLGLSAALTGCGLASTELSLEPGLASVKNLNLALGSTSAEEKSLRDAVLAWVGVDDYTENMSGYERGEAGKVIWSWLGLSGRPVIDLFSTENQNITIPMRPESPLFSTSTGRPVIDLFSTENQNIAIPKRLEINPFSTSTGHQNIALPKRPETNLFPTSTGHQNIVVPKRPEINLFPTSTGHQTTDPPKQQVTGLVMSTYPAIDLFSRLEVGIATSKHQEGEIDVFQTLGINQIRQDMGWYAETGLSLSKHLPRHRRHMVSSGQDTIICAQYDALISELFGDAQRSKGGSAQPQ
jgi:hypothetical protein